MLDRANRLSSSPDLFSKECQDLRTMFLKLKYPEKLIDSIFKSFHASQDQNQNQIEPIDSLVRIILPFKDQKSADSVRRQLSDLGKKIDRVLQPVFTSRKISEDLKVTETKPSLVNQQGVVYEFNAIRVMRKRDQKRDRLLTLKKTPYQQNCSFNFAHSFVSIHLVLL